MWSRIAYQDASWNAFGIADKTLLKSESSVTNIVFGGAGSTATPPDGSFDGPVLRVRHRTLFGGFGVIAAADDEVLDV